MVKLTFVQPDGASQTVEVERPQDSRRRGHDQGDLEQERAAGECEPAGSGPFPRIEACAEGLQHARKEEQPQRAHQ